MHLVVWVALCLGISTALRKRPAISVALALAVWTIVPGVASRAITGQGSGALSVHAGTWLILTTFLLLLITDPRGLAESLARRFLTFIAILLVIFAAVLETKTGSAGSGVTLVVDEMAAPFLAFWILSAVSLTRPGEMILVRNWLVGLAAGEAAFAIVQYLSGSALLYGSFFAHRYWYKTGWDRWMGTTDHPLVLSMMMCAAIPLLIGLRRSWLQPTLLVLMVIAVVITQSRTGVLAGGIGAIYVMLGSRTSTLRKVVTVVGIAVAAVFIATSSLSTGIVDRLQNDQGSALARGSAWTYFIDNWSHYTFTGGGISYNYQVASSGGLNTSFESAFLMYAVDLGIIIAVVFFVAQLVLVFRGSPRRVAGARLSALTVLVVCQTFNSLEVQTVAGMVVFVSIALAALPASQGEERDEAPRSHPVARAGTVSPAPV